LRHRIEHAQLLHPDDLSRFARLGVIASVQPIHATSDRYIADKYWGARARLAYPFRSLLASGARICFGSDGPVESIDPLKGIYAAVTRKRADEPGSRPWYPEERLTVDEAVRGYTEWAAYASYEERSRGTLSPGKLADLIVLSREIFNEPPEVIPETRVLMTVVGGKVVYRAG
ncbi:MAG: amidohydrolase, partial [Bacillota bacterium]